jgi:hypothetical protein
MKKLLYTALAVLVLNFANAQKQETLTNYTIMSLVKKGLSGSIIVSKIKQSVCNFDVSTDALVFMKDNNVTDDVINAMIEKSSVKTTDNNSSNNPDVSKDNIQQPQAKLSPEAQKIISNLDGSGIYFFDEVKNTYTNLDPTVVSGVTNKVNMPIAGGGMSSYSYIDGKEANLQITSTSPVFYFYFEQSYTSLNNSRNKTDQRKDNYMELLAGTSSDKNAKAFSPNDFKLLELDIKKKSRYFRSDLTGMTSRIASGYFRDFKYERISPNLYKLSPKVQLSKKAEYCFIYAGNTSNNSIYSQQQNREIKVFDFGIDLKK